MAVASWLRGSILKFVYHSSSSFNKSPGISFSTTDEGLANSFSQFGKVNEAKVVRDKVRNRSKVYGSVTFAEEDDARKALTAMNRQLLDGRVIFVDEETCRSVPWTPRRVADE